MRPIVFNCYAITLMEIIPESNDSFVSGYTDDAVIINSFNPDNSEIKQNKPQKKKKPNRK